MGARESRLCSHEHSVCSETYNAGMRVTAQEFRQRIADIDQKLQQVSEIQAAQMYAPGSWQRKEVLGHLLDSAANNHIRFVIAALNGSFQGPGYSQRDWVRIHAYAAKSWSTLLNHWRSQNALLADVVENLEPGKLGAPCTIGDNPPVTLGELIVDYLAHMDHHVEQIMGKL